MVPPRPPEFPADRCSLLFDDTHVIHIDSVRAVKMTDRIKDANRRILIIDDNEDIHSDFRKILGGQGPAPAALQEARSALFGDEPPKSDEYRQSYEIDSAFQGQQALEMVCQAVRDERPYAMAFVDVRMPPGWDGIETVQRLWKEYPELEVVMCTAYSDYSWDDMVKEFGQSDRFLILKKPFDNVEVRQLAFALTGKWYLEKQALLKVDDLERMVEERTSELLNLTESLKQAKVAAESANRAKSEFLANMSHEIRTPLTSILGYAELMFEECTIPTTRERLEVIRRNGEHLMNVINDILDLSKIEADRFVTEQISTSPIDLIADVLAVNRRAADVKGLTLKAVQQGALPERIQTDPTRLRQILVNLISNAVKFTERGSVRLAFQLLESPVEPPKLMFEVTDTGIGLDQEQIGKLFRPFVQADNSTTRKFAGTGLGLAISKRLAKMLGGDITVRSQPGSGSTFSVTIATGSIEGVPMIAQSVKILAPRTSAAYPAGTSSSGLRLEGRLLLAEDGPDNQLLISTLIRKYGVDVVIVGNGREAMDTALQASSRKEPFDLILMDMQMPEMDGYQATDALRRVGYAGPIVALTAHAMSEDREKCLTAGCSDYLSKPVSRDDLRRVLCQYLVVASDRSQESPIATLLAPSDSTATAVARG